MKKVTFILVSVLMTTFLMSQNVFYVKSDGDDGKPGNSWDNAYGTIFWAISKASAGDEIRIAQGTYTISTALNVKKSLTFKGAYNTTTGNQDYSQKSVMGGTNSGRFVWVNNGDALPTPPNVSFDGFIIANFSGAAGGALYYDNNTSGIVSNTVFKNNSATSNGGALNFNATGQSIVHTVVNCEFYNNTATGAGGALVGSNNLLNVDNCTFANNTSASATYSGCVFTTGRLNLRNSILWGNTNLQIKTPRGSHYLDRNIIEGGVSGIEIGTNATEIENQITSGKLNFVNNDVNVDAFNSNPLLQSISTGNLRLTVGSPAINAGNNNNIPAYITTDIVNAQRIIGGTVDLGCYEFDSTTTETSSRSILSDDNILAYPNPVTDILNIKVKNHSATQIRMYDISGTMVFQKNIESNLLQIDVKRFARGVYFLSVNNAIQKVVLH